MKAPVRENTEPSVTGDGDALGLFTDVSSFSRLLVVTYLHCQEDDDTPLSLKATASGKRPKMSTRMEEARPAVSSSVCFYCLISHSSLKAYVCGLVQ